MHGDIVKTIHIVIGYIQNHLILNKTHLIAKGLPSLIYFFHSFRISASRLWRAAGLDSYLDRRSSETASEFHQARVSFTVVAKGL